MKNGSLMKVESIAECSPWSILQYFWPSLSNNWSWKPIFNLFESDHFTQVLLYYTLHTFYFHAMDVNKYRCIQTLLDYWFSEVKGNVYTVESVVMYRKTANKVQ